MSTVQQMSSLSNITTDPLRVFKFQVTFYPPATGGLGAQIAGSSATAGGGIVYGFMTVSGPATNIEVIPYREGGMNALSMDTPVLTISGWKPMGEIEVGDRVIDPYGEPSKVQGVYPRGMRKTYRVSLADGRSVLADQGHLWQVETINHKTQMTVTTAELKELVEGRSLKARRAERTRNDGACKGVRVVEMVPAEFEAIHELPIDPYLLGILLAEGSLSNGPHFAQDPRNTEVIERCRAALPAGHVLRTYAGSGSRQYCADHRIVPEYDRGPGSNYILNKVKDLGLHGHRSWEKFIPDIYKFASVKDRLALLQGILDGDGQIQARKDKGKPDGTRIKFTFSSASEQLRDDVAELIRSLGGYCTKGIWDNVWYTSPNQATPKRGRTAYRLDSIQMPVNPFYHPAKANLFKPQNGAYHRKVVSVVPDGSAEVQCIEVSASSQLYVVNGYIPTHNTTTQKLPGQADFGAITMSHGLKLQAQQLDILWMQQLFTVMQGSGTQAPGSEFRMHADIYVLDHPVTTAAAPVKAAFRLYNTWPSSLAFSDFDAGANAFVIAQMSLAYEGFDVLVASSSGTSEVSFSGG